MYSSKLISSSHAKKLLQVFKSTFKDYCFIGSPLTERLYTEAIGIEVQELMIELGLGGS